MKLHLPSLKLRPPDLVYVGQMWWKILALGFLLAVGVSLWPSAYCALAGCGVKGKLCNGNCSQTCGPTNGLGVVVGCSRGAYGCMQDWIPNAWSVRYTNSGDCKVTEYTPTPSGYGCYLAGAGRWMLVRAALIPPAGGFPG